MESELNEISVRESKLLEGNTDETRPDLLPEYCHYRDDGCELSHSCLDCPFPQCIYDLPGGRQHWLKKLRDREIVRLFCAESKGVKELALMFGLSQRTIQRALKSSTLPSRPCPEEEIEQRRPG